jgi:signal transduction histidine kinase
LDADSASVLEVVIGELRATTRDVLDLVDGVPPVELGEGRLVAAVTDLARRAPVPVGVLVEGNVCAEGDAEAVLFYVCSEALANAAKHAAAAHVIVRLREGSGVLELAVMDDGRGGAEPTGSGLQGLSDRLAGHGGRLEVRSPRGGGPR